MAQVADAPVEKANPIVIVVFLVLFIGGCIAYAAYAMWAGKDKKEKKE